MNQIKAKRRAVMAAAAVAVLTAVCGGVNAAEAFEGPGIVDTSTTAVPPMPGTTRNVDAWKLVGYWSIPGQAQGAPEIKGDSATQIAPQWIVTARHNQPADPTPYLQVTFRNALGVALIDKVYPVPGADHGDRNCDATGGPDITISHLATPIAGPAGGFPKILSDPLPPTKISAGGYSNPVATLPGYVLGTGNTGNTGVIKAVWMTTGDRSPFDPYQEVDATDGDSGGGEFWYPSATSDPIFANVNSVAGPPFGENAQLAGSCGAAPDIKAWADSVFANHADQARPITTTLEQAAPSATHLPMNPDALAVVKGSGSATSIVLSISPPANLSGWSTPTVAKYRVAMVPPAGSGLPTVTSTTSSASATAATSITVAGLNTGVLYTPYAASLTVSGLASRTSVTAAVASQIPPQALTNVKGETYGTMTNSVLQTCVQFSFGAPSSGPTPTEVLFIGPGIRKTVDWSTAPLTSICDLTPDDTANWFVVPLNGPIGGVVNAMSLTTPIGATGQPTDVKVLNGQDNCMSVSWTAPTPPTGGGVLQSYSLLAQNVTPGPGSQFLTLPSDKTTWSGCAMPGGANYGVSVRANWNRTDVPGATWGEMKSYVTATAPQAVTAIAAEPYGNAASTGLKTCAQFVYGAVLGGTIPTSVVVRSGTITQSASYAPGQPVTVCGLDADMPYMFGLTTYAGSVKGVSMFTSFVTPPDTTGQPNNVRAVNDATCTTVSWDAPNTPVGGGILQSYKLAIYDLSWTTPNRVISPISTGTYSVRLCDLPRSSTIMFAVAASWNRTVPGSVSNSTLITTPA